MHAWSSRRCVGSSALQIESVVWRTRRRGQPATSRQLLSCSVPRWQPCRSRVCFAALSPQTESSCQVFRESSSCARASAALVASGSFHLYSWTRHSVVPLESREIALHSTTSLRRVCFLPHAAMSATEARRTSFTRWDFMAPNIANGASAEQQEHVVKRVGPSSYTESPEQVQATEKQAGDRAKHEGIDVKPVAKRADIVESGENERAEHRRGRTGDQRTQAQYFRCAPREQADEDDAEQQLFIDAGADRQHQHRHAAEVLGTESDDHGWRGVAQQRRGETAHDQA